MTLINKAQEVLDSFLSLVHRYVLELIILMFVALFTFWACGFFANALYGYKFDLQSCWGGFSAIGGAGVLAAIKYCTDSWKNSPEGVPPNHKLTQVLDRNGDGNISVGEVAETAIEKIGLKK